MSLAAENVNAFDELPVVPFVPVNYTPPPVKGMKVFARASTYCIEMPLWLPDVAATTSYTAETSLACGNAMNLSARASTYSMVIPLELPEVVSVTSYTAEMSAPPPLPSSASSTVQSIVG